ncbi:MAG: AI-2E family transporter [Acidobacteria bacterium]|nr:AI-2E family transporter [Acidobacteriota bacterium]MBV9069443.1 AI-2E family transporter [Acidobacteriota bacterium]MBV9187687.1 AI-2E family transporter [Acidobacteriota bacterium]
MPDITPDADEARQQHEWHLAGIIFFALIALVVLYATFIILDPFLAPIMLGAVLVTVTFSVFQRVRARMHGRANRAAAVMLFLITFIILLPALLITILLVQEANVLVKHLQSGDATRALQRLDISNRMPWLQRIAPNFDPAAINPAHVIMPIVQKAPTFIAEHGAGLIGGIAGVVIALFLVLLSAYFFYVEGETIVAEGAALSPLPARYNHQFAENFKAVVDATFRGQVITSLTQGIFIGIGLAIAGVPGAILWGAVATVLSLLPIVGSAAVWIPAALWLYITATMGERSYFGVIFLTIWGVIVVPIIEHVVRPWAMKGKMQLPAIPLLVSVLGGMEAFGFVGLVVGPLVFSLLMSIIDIYKQSFRIPNSEGEVA